MIEEVVERLAHVLVAQEGGEGSADDAGEEEEVEEDGRPDLVANAVSFLLGLGGATLAEARGVEAAAAATTEDEDEPENDVEDGENHGKSHVLAGGSDVTIHVAGVCGVRRSILALLRSVIPLPGLAVLCLLPPAVIFRLAETGYARGVGGDNALPTPVLVGFRLRHATPELLFVLQERELGYWEWERQVSGGRERSCMRGNVCEAKRPMSLSFGQTSVAAEKIPF